MDRPDYIFDHSAKIRAVVIGVLVVAIGAISMALIERGIAAVKTDSWSYEYKRGWCAGYASAAKTVRQNRDHWRRLLGEPEMSPEEVLEWIYARPWLDGAKQRLAPRTLGQPPGIAQVGPPVIQSVDLYITITKITGSIVVQDDSGIHQFICEPKSDQ